MRKFSRKYQAGVTIIETLIALGLMTVCALILSASLRLVIDTQSSLSEQQKRSYTFQSRSHLRELLGQTKLPSDDVSSFGGDQNGFWFKTKARPLYWKQAQDMDVAVQFENNSLIMQAGPEWSTLLADDLSSIRFSYFDAEALPPDWRDDWPFEDRIPVLVKIESSPEEVSTWPPFAVALEYFE